MNITLISVLSSVLPGDLPSLTEGQKLLQLLAMTDSHLCQEVVVGTGIGTSGGTGTGPAIETEVTRGVMTEAGGATRAGMLLFPAGLRGAILLTKAAIGVSRETPHYQLPTTCEAWQSTAKCRRRSG